MQKTSFFHVDHQTSLSDSSVNGLLVQTRALLIRSVLIWLTFFIAGASMTMAQDEKIADKTNEDQAVSKNLTLDEIFAGNNPKTLADMKAMQAHIRELAERLKPATVGLRVGGAQGSGVIISRDGYILTAAHVIGRPGITCDVVMPDGRTVKAKTLGLNHSVDSGLAKIVDEGNFPYLDMGNSGELKNGQWVMSIGHPGGFDKLRGPVVRIGRITYKSPTVLKTDCTLVGGDSGGPLFDMSGNVIGIHSRIGGNIEDNMHVPVDTYSEEWDKFEKSEVIGRSRSSGRSSGRLGFSTGIKLDVLSVSKGGAAEKAGLKVGDVIIKFKDTKIKSRTELRAATRMVRKGQEIEFTVKRGDKEIKIKIKAE